ncbi:MAG TPA: hypothetical protein VGO60_00450 [Iamia sp.]|jgi:hypothetical protein|nr:hypothetical protein [Iamia sp.]
MGQPIVVIEKPSVANPGMVRFETNRAITGMGHEVYPAGTEVRGDRPPDEIARRLLAHGGIEGIHINGSVVTVDLEKGARTDGMREIIESLFIHYPPTIDDPDAAVADADAPETEGELVEQESAAPADEAPAPEHIEPVPAAEAAAEEIAEATPDRVEAPAATSSGDAAEPDEETESDVEQAEGDAPTKDQVALGDTPSDPPADDPTTVEADGTEATSADAPADDAGDEGTSTD